MRFYEIQVNSTSVNAWNTLTGKHEGNKVSEYHICRLLMIYGMKLYFHLEALPHYRANFVPPIFVNLHNINCNIFPTLFVTYNSTFNFPLSCWLNCFLIELTFLWNYACLSIAFFYARSSFLSTHYFSQLSACLSIHLWKLCRLFVKF